jgi:hypothetical protein
MKVIILLIAIALIPIVVLAQNGDPTKIKKVNLYVGTGRNSRYFLIKAYNLWIRG